MTSTVSGDGIDLTVSVALCTHNGVRYLAEQVRSICRQTYRPAEIVLSDDASSDDSVDMVHAVVEECAHDLGVPAVPLRVLRNAPPLRVTRNFEQAIRACHGDLVALSDQDDIWVPHRLERMVVEFRRSPNLLLLHSDARLVDALGAATNQTLFHALAVTPEELRLIHQGSAFDVFLRRNLVTGATTVFRRSLFDRAQPFPTQWLHDEWLGIVAAAIGHVDVLEEQLIDYRQHGANQVGAFRRTWLAKVRKVLDSRGEILVRRAAKKKILIERLLQLGSAVSPATIEKTRRRRSYY